MRPYRRSSWICSQVFRDCDLSYGGRRQPADNVYDQKKSTSWSPAAEDPDPWVGLDFDETVYTDWFRLYGNLDSVTSYEIQMSEGGDDWSAVYSGTTAPESGEKVYIQGTQTCSGKMWRVVFHGVDDAFAVSELEVNTYINWAIEDGAVKVEVPYGNDSNVSRYKDTCLVDGNRIASAEAGAWIAGDVAGSGNNYAIIEFSESRPLSGVNLVAVQEEVYSKDNYWWTGADGEIPDDGMTSALVENSYTVYYKDPSGNWIQAGTVATSDESAKKVLTSVMFSNTVTTKAIKVEVGSYYWIHMAEIEPVQKRKYTLNGVKEGYQELGVEREWRYYCRTERQQSRC